MKSRFIFVISNPTLVGEKSSNYFKQVSQSKTPSSEGMPMAEMTLGSMAKILFRMFLIIVKKIS